MREADRVEARQAFAWKAAWFSFYGPFGGVLVVLASIWFANHSNGIPTLVEELLIGGALLIQAASLTMGFAGSSITDSHLAKAIAIIGILFSLVLGFVTLSLIVLLLLANSRGAFGGSC
jgi:hypothetical protein